MPRGRGTATGRRIAVAVAVLTFVSVGLLTSCAAKSDTASTTAATSESTAPPRTMPPNRDQTGGLGKSKGTTPGNKKTQTQDGGRTGNASSDQTAPPGSTPGEIQQWATRASATSSYGPIDGDPWNASQATGPPNVDPNCGDDNQAWAALKKDTVDTLTLTYDTPVLPSEIRVFQTYNPGQVAKMEMKGPDGQSAVIFEGKPTAADGCPVEGYLKDLHVPFPVDTVLITIDQSQLGIGWAEIDAVQLIGKPATAGARSPNS